MMRRSLIRWKELICVLCIHVQYLYGFGDLISMREPCEYTIYRLNEDKSFKIQWRGAESSNFERCKIGFIGRDLHDGLKEYQVCVEPKEFYLQSKGIYLKYMTGSRSVLRRTYEKDDQPQRFCAAQSEYLEIEIFADNQPGRYVERMDTTSSYISLDVTATLTSNPSATASKIGAIVGGVVGGLVLLGIIIIVFIIVKCNRRRSTGGQGQVFKTHQEAVPLAPPGAQTTFPGNPQTAYPPPTVPFPQQQGDKAPEYPQQPPQANHQYPVQGYGYSSQQYPAQPQTGLQPSNMDPAQVKNTASQDMNTGGRPV